ncbi:MAG TPA: hypothetical protein ACFYEL_09855, partial [Candidatus Wunengus californicus]|uniref:hypothetical protein n=1 Tax=Candidatus Wunengus californicus TaxID=3367619 RepID=UPI0040286111
TQTLSHKGRGNFPSHPSHPFIPSERRTWGGINILRDTFLHFRQKYFLRIREIITQRHEAAKNKTEVESLRRWEVGNPNLPTSFFVSWRLCVRKQKDFFFRLV